MTETTEYDARQIRALTTTDEVSVAPKAGQTFTVDNTGYMATTPTIYNVTMTNADAEYSQALTAATKKFMIQTRDRSAFRFAFATGKVATPTAPYLTIAANEVYYEDHVKLTSKTLYFASASAGKIIEIVEWV